MWKGAKGAVVEKLGKRVVDVAGGCYAVQEEVVRMSGRHDLLVFFLWDPMRGVHADCHQEHDLHSFSAGRTDPAAVYAPASSTSWS
jgi:hypothetical protein